MYMCSCLQPKQWNGGTNTKHCTICCFAQSRSTGYLLSIITTLFKQRSGTIMLNSYFYMYNVFSENVNEDFWYSNSQRFAFVTQYGLLQAKQWNGGHRNKHCNLMIYTVPLNRVLVEHCYYNIQTRKYHNNAELMFLQYICRRGREGSKTLKLQKMYKKHKNLHFSKSKKHKIQFATKTVERGTQK